MAHKTLIGGTAYEISGGKTLIDGTGYSIAGGKTLIGGTGYDISFGTPIGSLAIGSSVYLNENGSPVEYLIVNQGIPSNSSLYDSSCDGTWLLRKDIYTTMAADTSDNDYKKSDVHAYLNGTFLGLFDSDIQSAIQQVKIPYSNGVGNGSSVASGSNGLSTKIFPLSGYEVGWTNRTNLPVGGACLSYFSGTSTIDSKRIAYLNSTATAWWLRDPSLGNAVSYWCVSTNGGPDWNGRTTLNGIRPALVLLSETLVDSSGNVLIG